MDIKIVSQEGSITGNISSSNKLKGYMVSLEPIADYEEPYEIIPKLIEQTIETSNKHATNDLIVKAISYKEVENEYGGITCLIATDI